MVYDHICKFKIIVADFLSKLKSNMGSHAEDTSYSQSFTCYSEDEKPRKQTSSNCERSASLRSSPNVTLNSLKNIWSSSCGMPSFAEGGAVKAQAKKLANMGRDGDTELVHVNKDEERLLKAYGGRGSINPKTGLREYVNCGECGWDPCQCHRPLEHRGREISHYRVPQKEEMHDQVDLSNFIGDTAIPKKIRGISDKLQDFGKGLPPQVGETCALQTSAAQNDYLNKKFKNYLNEEKTKLEQEQDPELQDPELQDPEMQELIRKVNEENKKIITQKQNAFGKEIKDLLYGSKKENKPNRLVEDFIKERFLPGLIKSSDEVGSKYRAKNLLNFSGIKTDDLNAENNEIGNLYDFIDSRLDQNIPVTISDNVRYREANPGAPNSGAGRHSMVVVGNDVYDQKLLESEIENRETKSSYERTRKEQKSLEALKLMKELGIHRRMQVYDPNDDHEREDRVFKNILIDDETNRGYTPRRLKNARELSPAHRNFSDFKQYLAHRNYLEKREKPFLGNIKRPTPFVDFSTRDTFLTAPKVNRTPEEEEF
jgi:hypothetical protein